MTEEAKSELEVIENREKRLQAQELEFGESGVKLETFNDVWTFAKWAKASRMVPDGMTAEGVVIAIQKGQELGFSPMQSLYSIPVVKGRPTLEGKAMIALVNMKDLTYPDGQIDAGCDGTGKARVGWCTSHKKGWKEPRRTEFSWSQAEAAGLTGKTKSGAAGMYMKYGEDMLKWKAVNRHCDTYYPEVTHGLMNTSIALAVLQGARDVTPDEGDRQPSAPDPLLEIEETVDVLDVEVVASVTEDPVEAEPTCGKEMDGGSPCPAPPGHNWDCTTGEVIEDEPAKEYTDDTEGRAEEFADVALEQDREALEEEDVGCTTDEELPAVCGKGPTGNECMQGPGHEGDCDWKVKPIEQESML